MTPAPTARSLSDAFGERLQAIETARSMCPHIAETEGLIRQMETLQTTCQTAVDGLALHAHSHEVAAAGDAANAKRADRGIEWWKLILGTVAVIAVALIGYLGQRYAVTSVQAAVEEGVKGGVESAVKALAAPH